MGAAGEAAAVRFLQAKGLVILDRNWRGQGGELDIVAFAEPSIVAVVEVKTRSGSGFGDPAVAVTGLKYSRLRRLAGQWVASHDVPAQEIRIDIVGVMMSRDGRLRAIDHIEGAFS
jgi:putative endonuclease